MKILENLDLTDFNSYRLKAVATKAYFPETIDDVKLVSKLDNLIILGGGNNVILSKESYEKENFVFIKDNFSGIKKTKNGTLCVKAGTDLKDLSIYAYENALKGLEYFYDIPGCVGGATIMNAGSKGVSFSDYIVNITYYDIEKKEIKTMTKTDAMYDYRKSALSDKNVIVLCVDLSLDFGDKNEIWNLMQENKKLRWEKQPREYPSAGSVFKRPDGHFVGPMITEVGMKGKRMGDAMISEKHAGFIVNVGEAKASDIMNLIKDVQKKVKYFLGVELELEQKVI